MVNIEQFFELVERFAEARSFSESTVSLMLFNDGKRLKVLREGGDVGVRKVEDAVQYLSDHWPEGSAWPKGIKRPSRVQ